jgi:AcrR family transcriptional regulator
MQKSHTNPPHETSDRILDAALELFAEHGYDGTGVQEIISAVDLTKPTLYHHFGSKAGLLAALIEREAASFLDDLKKAADYHGDLPNSLDKVVESYFRFTASHRAFCQFSFSLAALSAGHEAANVSRQFFQKQRETLEAMFEAACKEHGNMRGRHRRYALSLMGMIGAQISFALKTGDSLSPKLRRELVQQFSYGIYS